MNNVITTETIKQGGGGIPYPEHKPGKIRVSDKGVKK
jgi:hypothetical protein